MPHHISKPRNAGLCGFCGLEIKHYTSAHSDDAVTSYRRSTAANCIAPPYQKNTTRVTKISDSFVLCDLTFSTHIDPAQTHNIDAIQFPHWIQ